MPLGTRKPPRKKPRERRPPPAPAAQKCFVGGDTRSDALANPASEDAIGDAASREGTSSALDDLAGEDVVGESTTREDAIADMNTSAMGDITGHALANVDGVLNDGATIGLIIDRGSFENTWQTAEHGLSDCLHMLRLQDLKHETASQSMVIQGLELELQSYKQSK
ncbi:hypothetical protein HPB47_015346 [Ixodes persulcatus]|uniref:Uncharacterized protein n=1 Tax=Ixodes persulcatus TaxID=34615 RepID=A0AC60QWA2_IXOPE|nr:hypothetical protein HPB47_015346 [Ixodes persulcatus]